MDIKKEFDSNKLVLINMSDKEYSFVISDIIKSLKGKSVCYITLNKTFDSLKELFQQKEIDVSNVVFVDAISKVIEEKPVQTANCYFLNSPDSLEDLFKMIEKFLRHKFDSIIFDSITNLLIYRGEEVVDRFVINLIKNIRKAKTNGIICVTNSLEVNKRKKELINLTSKLVDKVIEVDGKV